VGFGGKVDAVLLGFGQPFGAETRLRVRSRQHANHKAGHVCCGEGTDLHSGDIGFTDDFCEPILPPPRG
jgi:hypothetical protein